MADATSLTPPSPGLSVTLLQMKVLNTTVPPKPKGSEKVKMHKKYYKEFWLHCMRKCAINCIHEYQASEASEASEENFGKIHK